ncbi:phosphoglycolate phosphatase [Pseudonocardia hierapolitana]|uniref:Phosphoglycolate phosphatase n=1 Tax=Pseudonocardia hierapolitana TaxID=1128676 RepID=A0A561SWA8_9PSEU|nr:phosphoglycolate phosphatase [Pseudonocardia hierapolitana]
MRSVRTVLLDLDGTLVDSASTIVEHLAAAIAEVGFPVPDAARLRLLVGPPFETALPELGLTEEQTAAAIVAYRTSYDAVAATVTPVYPGIPELLERLHDDGFRLATATSKPEELARKIVAGTGLASHLDLVGGADHVAGRVGKAAVVGSVLERLGLDPALAPVVLVGDRHHDVEGAAAHGVPTIGVTWGYAEPGELAGARLVVEDLDELTDALRGNTVWSTTLPRDAA